MTEKKAEEFFRVAVIINNAMSINSKKLEESSRRFEESYEKMGSILDSINEMALYTAEAKRAEAKRFADEIKDHIETYKKALREMTPDIKKIEKNISLHNRQIEDRLAGSGNNNNDAAVTDRKSGCRTGFFIYLILFALIFISGDALMKISNVLEQNSVLRLSDKGKELYESNNVTALFLSENGIDLMYGETNEDETQKDLQNKPYIQIESKKIDEIYDVDGYMRITLRRSDE